MTFVAIQLFDVLANSVFKFFQNTSVNFYQFNFMHLNNVVLGDYMPC